MLTNGLLILLNGSMRMVMDLAITPREPMGMIALEYLAHLLKTEMVVRIRMAMVIQTLIQGGELETEPMRFQVITRYGLTQMGTE